MASLYVVEEKNREGRWVPDTNGGLSAFSAYLTWNDADEWCAKHQRIRRYVRVEPVKRKKGKR